MAPVQRKRKKRKLSTVKAAAWDHFSRYIRLKHSVNGYCTCVTCGVLKHWKDIDAGHYVPKSRGNSIYFVEENVHPQCRACNRFKGGMLIEYGIYMQSMYGPNIDDYLLKLSRQTLHFTLNDYEEIEQEYRLMANELEQMLG